MIAFTTAASTADGPTAGVGEAERRLVGVVLLCCAAFVLPALMRLVAPAVAAVGNGGSGAGALAGGLAAASTVATAGKSAAARSAGGVATGAKVVGRGPSGHGGSPVSISSSRGQAPGSARSASASPQSAGPAGATPNRAARAGTPWAAKAAGAQGVRPHPARRPDPGNDIPV
jgi:hypothetical protein